MNSSSSSPKVPEIGKTSVRMGSAFLRPAEEKGHYELMRYIVTVRNEDGKIVREQHGNPIGPLAVYRIKRNGDKIALTSDFTGPPREMKTSDPKTKQPIDLVLVWWPQMEEK